MLKTGTACSAATAGDTYCTTQCVCSRTKCHNSEHSGCFVATAAGLANMITHHSCSKSFCFMV